MKKAILIFLFLLLAGIIYINRPLFEKQKKIQIYGAIVPHHGLAAEILDNSFRRLSESSKPDTIVIYGTNHYFPVSDTFTTTAEIKNKYGLQNVLADNERIKGDHSIQTEIPYIGRYFPNSKIIPILVSERYESLQKLNEDVQTFSDAFGKNTLYIASVDFAHNVSLEEGLEKNSESIINIENFNLGEILKYSDDHMDSPVAITALMLTMQKLGANHWTTWYSSHGGLITNDINLNGTSYVVGIFSTPIQAGRSSSYK